MKALVWMPLVALLSAPVAAPAQEICSSSDVCSIGISSVSSTTTVGIGATTLTRIRSRRMAALDLYLRHNQVALLAAAALGAGTVIDDLAELVGVAPDQRAAFARKLRQRRDLLNSVFEPTLDTEYPRAVALVLAFAPPRMED